MGSLVLNILLLRTFCWFNLDCGNLYYIYFIL